MRKVADRLNVVLLIVGMIAVITYPYLRDYSLKVFMPRYMMFRWYLLFPMLSFSVGYLLYRVALLKATITMPVNWRRILLAILYILIIGYLITAVITCIHCYAVFLPSAVADPLLYWIAMIYEHHLSVFAIIGGLFSVAVL